MAGLIVDVERGRVGGIEKVMLGPAAVIPDAGIARVADGVGCLYAIADIGRGGETRVRVGSDVRADRADLGENAVNAALDLESGLVPGVVGPLQVDRIVLHRNDAQVARLVGRGDRSLAMRSGGIHDEGVN